VLFHASPYVFYVTLCGLFSRKGCGFSGCIPYVFERCAFAEAVGVIHTSPYVFFCFFCGKNSYKNL